MPKNITFTTSEPLTTAQMNSLLQDGQIQQTKGQSTTELMSQKAITDNINESINSAIDGTIANNINNAITTAINGTIADNIKNSASSIIVTSKPEFGNASTLQGVLDYLANILNGTNTVTKIKAKEIDLVD